MKRSIYLLAILIVSIICLPVKAQTKILYSTITATASNSASGTSPINSTNNNAADAGWQTISNSATEWIRWDFGSAKRIQRVEIAYKSGYQSYTNYIQGSNTGGTNSSEWTTVSNIGTQAIILNLATAYRYFRITNFSYYGTTTSTNILEIYFYEMPADLITSNITAYGNTSLRGNLSVAGNVISDLKIQGNSTITGNLGIGTTSPREKLEVNGNILIPADCNLKFGTENASTGYLKIHNSLGSYNTYADYLGNLYFRNHAVNGDASGSALSLQKDGTVIVGCWEKYNNTVINTQGYKFMVNGGILCNEVKVITNVPTSDYVFNTDYKLKSLAEVEAFVKENKHLPEVPSAEEFKKNGYKVGDMDDLLLRKVEELTLYVIEQNKRIEALEKENKELKLK